MWIAEYSRRETVDPGALPCSSSNPLHAFQDAPQEWVGVRRAAGRQAPLDRCVYSPKAQHCRPLRGVNGIDDCTLIHFSTLRSSHTSLHYDAYNHRPSPFLQFRPALAGDEAVTVLQALTGLFDHIVNDLLGRFDILHHSQYHPQSALHPRDSR